MSLLLNVVLLLLGTIATFAAFGGETWQEGPGPLLPRITTRGWVSVVCFLSALLLGTVKEISASRAEDATANQLSDAQQRLSAANAKLDTLAGELTSTREKLSKQTDINLITTLSRDVSVQRVAWWLELGGSARSAKDVIHLLGTEVPSEYRDVVEMKLKFRPYLGASTHIVYRYDGDSVTTEYPYLNGHHPPDVQLPIPLDRVRAALPWNAEEDTISQFILEQKAKPRDRNTSAAIAYSDFSRRNEVGSISLNIAREFPSEGEARTFLKKRPLLREMKMWSYGDGRVRVEFELPPAVRDKFLSYWRKNLRSAHVHAYLDVPAKLMMSVSASISETPGTDSSVGVAFRSSGPPEIKVGVREF